MTTAKESLHILREIQTVEAEINALTDQIGLCRKRLEGQEHSLLEKRERYSERCQSVEDLHLERRRLEKEIAEFSGKVQKFQRQLMTVKNDKEYKAMTHELDQASSELDRRETRLLELMEQEEDQESNLEKSGDEIETDAEAIGEEIHRLDTQIHEKSEHLKRLEAEHGRWLQKLDDPNLRQLYNNLSMRYPAHYMAPVVRGGCGGCQMSIPANTLVKVRQQQEIVTCEDCGRILIAEGG